MSTPKRFYWMKLKESFMSSDTVDYFMSQPDGANYVVLYQMLCLKTINTDGRLSRQIGEIIIPYDIDKIRRDLKYFSADTIRVALNLYKAVGLIYEEVDGTLVLADHANLVGSETDAAARMRSSRANRNAELPSGVTDCEQSANIVTPDIRDRDRDKRLEIEDRDKEKRGRERKGIKQDSTDEEDGIICTDPLRVSVLELPLNDKTMYPIYQEAIDEWHEIYPAVDVLQELRAMKGWCKGNPTKRKTRSGIERFINSWLAKAQNKGGASGFSQPRPSAGTAAMNDLKTIHEIFSEDEP